MSFSSNKCPSPFLLGVDVKGELKGLRTRIEKLEERLGSLRRMKEGSSRRARGRARHRLHLNSDSP